MVLLGSVVPLTVARATPSASTTLTVSVPGPISGCYYYGAHSNSTLRAILDLVRPSAFSTDNGGNTVGAQGPILQAELISLAPQTVVYTLNTKALWSNGTPFSGVDLQQWYQRAAAQPTALTDGYRAIGSLVVNSLMDKVTVIFSHPYSDWQSLFHDVNQHSISNRCVLSTLAKQPSLGPYQLISISPSRANLMANPLWRGPIPLFDHVVIRTNVSPLHFAHQVG